MDAILTTTTASSGFSEGRSLMHVMATSRPMARPWSFVRPPKFLWKGAGPVRNSLLLLGLVTRKVYPKGS